MDVGEEGGREGICDLLFDGVYIYTPVKSTVCAKTCPVCPNA